MKNYSWDGFCLTNSLMYLNLYLEMNMGPIILLEPSRNFKEAKEKYHVKDAVSNNNRTTDFSKINQTKLGKTKLKIQQNRGM